MKCIWYYGTPFQIEASFIDIGDEPEEDDSDEGE